MLVIRMEKIDYMKQFFYILLFISFVCSLQAQTKLVYEQGTASFLSSRNVYVKFASTAGMAVGDTLFVIKDEAYVPALIISNTSSTSAVCTPLTDHNWQKGDPFYAAVEVKIKKKEPKKKITPIKTEVPDKTIADEIHADEQVATTGEAEARKPARKEKLRGRVSAASYSNFSEYRDIHRMRYAFSFKGDNIRKSKFSTENNITFRHTLGEWQQVKENLNQALKVYALSVKYELDDHSSVTFGRKINPRISSMGALDGLQLEKSWGNFLIGALAGSRPDYSDYSFNINLLQAGAYLSRVSSDPKKYQQTTVGFAEQRNRGEIDRRLVYFQHTGQLFKNMNLFSSFELDLYENINNEANNTTRLTNIFVSLRYTASKKLRLTASYDARRNIIYYESYKHFIDQLIDNETRQGLRFGFSHRPHKLISWGVNSSLRFQKNQQNQSKNINAFVNFSRIPNLGIRASLRANYLETDYIRSQVYSLNLSRAIIKQKLNADIYYRFMNYAYQNNDTKVLQNIGGASFSYQVLKKLTLYLYYEGTFDDQGRVFQRFNSKLIQRF